MTKLAETDHTTLTWLLLIYTIPAEPSRMRAFIWRKLKKIGAISIRDGVWTLPENACTTVVFRAIATKVEQFGGEAILAERAHLNPTRANAITVTCRTARAAEYEELAQEAEQFLMHMRRESKHRNFDVAELEELEQDLSKVKRWGEQIQARDYFSARGRGRVEELLRQCEDVLTSFRDEAFSQEDGTQ